MKLRKGWEITIDKDTVITVPNSEYEWLKSTPWGRGPYFKHFSKKRVFILA